MHDCTTFESQLTAALLVDVELPPSALSSARACARCQPLLHDLATTLSAHARADDEPPAAIATRAVISGRRWAVATYAVGKLIKLGISLTIVIAWLTDVELRDVQLVDLGLHGPARETLVTFTVAGIGYLALAGWRGRRLYARWSRRQLQGICTGIAEYFVVPLWIVRIAFIWLFVAGLGGGTMYFLLAFLVDFHPDDRHHLTWFRMQRWWRNRSKATDRVAE